MKGIFSTSKKVCASFDLLDIIRKTTSIINKMFYPYVQNVIYQDPFDVFTHFHQQWGAVFLDSAQLRPNCGRYSFIGIDPFSCLVCKNETQDPFQLLAEQLAKFPMQFHPDLPPFQGGAVGFFSYDLYRYLEDIPKHALDDMKFPDMAIGFYDLVMAFDHEKQSAWVFSSGYPLKETLAREERAHSRLIWLTQELQNIKEERGVLYEKENKFLTDRTDLFYDKKDFILNEHCMDASFSPGHTERYIETNFSSESYQSAVKKVIHYILQGDIFEANISQRFKTILPDFVSAFDLYRCLRSLNPAPFAAYLNFGDSILASASPERFLKLYKAQVESRPIKGTRKRSQLEIEDKKLASELLNSAKDHAENVMIVDLLRNDLSRVCEDHSVKVPKLCSLESYATVHHLVSVIEGQLKQGKNAIDLLRATFPGGSITGAPKIRAMEIIAEIEPVARGPYCGSIGYIGFNGDMDTSITIRTYAIKDNKATFQAGGAVVADSDPLAEYEETLTKVQSLREIIMKVALL